MFSHYVMRLWISFKPVSWVSLTHLQQGKSGVLPDRFPMEGEVQVPHLASSDTQGVCVCGGRGREFPLLLGGDGNFDSPCGLHWHYRCSRWTSLVTNGEESPRSLLGLLTPPQSGCWQPSLQFHEDRSLGSSLYLCWCGYGWGYSFICDVWLE